MSFNIRGTLVVLFVLAAPAVAQIIREPFPRGGISPALQSYLELSRDQVTAIQRLNGASAQFQSEKLRRSLQVQLEIGQETAKTPLDAMALGVRYLELEAIRREVATDDEKTYAEIQKVLNEAQKTKVRALVAAMQLQGVICEAQAQNILPGLRPGNIIPASRISPLPVDQTGIASFLLGTPTFIGCSSGSFGFTQLPPVQP